MVLKYEDDMHRGLELDDVGLQYFGHQLVNLVSFYKQFITIEDPDVFNKLNTLYEVGNAIITRNYHLLLNDPNAVRQSDYSSIEEYQLMLFESMADQMYSNGKPF